MFEISGDADKMTLMISGEVTIQNALAFRDALKEWSGKGGILEMNLQGVNEADLTCLQLLCSAHRYLKNVKKDMVIAGKIPECIDKTAREAGFVRARECCVEEGHKCIWTMRNEK